MPKNKNKSNVKCKTEDLWYDDEDVIGGRKQPSPKLKTIPKEQLPKFVRSNYRNKSPAYSSDGSGSKITVKAAALPKERARRSSFDTNWRVPCDTRPGSFIPWRQRSKSPSPMPTSRLRSGRVLKDKAEYRRSPARFHKSYTFKLRAEEPTVLRGLKTGKLYARFPVDTTISADAQGQGQKGVTTFQTNKAVQFPERNGQLSTFGKEFGRLRL